MLYLQSVLVAFVVILQGMETPNWECTAGLCILAAPSEGRGASCEKRTDRTGCEAGCQAWGPNCYAFTQAGKICQLHSMQPDRIACPKGWKPISATYDFGGPGVYTGNKANTAGTRECCTAGRLPPVLQPFEVQPWTIDDIPDGEPKAGLEWEFHPKGNKQPFGFHADNKKIKSPQKKEPCQWDYAFQITDREDKQSVPPGLLVEGEEHCFIEVKTEAKSVIGNDPETVENFICPLVGMLRMYTLMRVGTPSLQEVLANAQRPYENAEKGRGKTAMCSDRSYAFNQGGFATEDHHLSQPHIGLAPQLNVGMPISNWDPTNYHVDSDKNVHGIGGQLFSQLSGVALPLIFLPQEQEDVSKIARITDANIRGMLGLWREYEYWMRNRPADDHGKNLFNVQPKIEFDPNLSIFQSAQDAYQRLFQGDINPQFAQKFFEHGGKPVKTRGRGDVPLFKYDNTIYALGEFRHAQGNPMYETNLGQKFADGNSEWVNGLFAIMRNARDLQLFRPESRLSTSNKYRSFIFSNLVSVKVRLEVVLCCFLITISIFIYFYSQKPRPLDFQDDYQEL